METASEDVSRARTIGRSLLANIDSFTAEGLPREHRRRVVILAARQSSRGNTVNASTSARAASSAEDGAGWLAFFRDLVARGLSGVARLSGDHPNRPVRDGDDAATVARALTRLVAPLTGHSSRAARDALAALHRRE